MNIKLFGVRIYISFLFTAVTALMVFTDRTGLITATALAVFSHESAHLAAMKHFGCAPKEIMLIPGSIRIIEPHICDRRRENIILLCGPIVNIMLFMFIFPFDGACGHRFSAVQLVVAVFNMLPAKGLDGGSLLFNLLLSLFPVTVARLIFVAVSGIFGAAVAAFGIIYALGGTVNYSLIILGIYIIVFTFLKN